MASSAKVLPTLRLNTFLLRKLKALQRYSVIRGIPLISLILVLLPVLSGLQPL